MTNETIEEWPEIDCPICKQRLGTALGLGLVCATKDCPVSDDYKSWSYNEKGRAIKEDTQLIAIYTELDSAREEIKELKDALSEAVGDIEGWVNHMKAYNITKYDQKDCIEKYKIILNKDYLK